MTELANPSMSTHFSPPPSIGHNSKNLFKLGGAVAIVAAAITGVAALLFAEIAVLPFVALGLGITGIVLLAAGSTTKQENSPFPELKLPKPAPLPGFQDKEDPKITKKVKNAHELIKIGKLEEAFKIATSFDLVLEDAKYELLYAIAEAGVKTKAFEIAKKALSRASSLDLRTKALQEQLDQALLQEAQARTANKPKQAQDILKEISNEEIQNNYYAQQMRQELKKGDFKSAEEYLQRIAFHSRMKFECEIDQARSEMVKQQIRNGKLKAALALCKEIRSNALKFPLIRLIANEYFLKQDYKLAKEALDAARRDPEQTTLCNQFAETLLKQQNFDAIEPFVDLMKNRDLEIKWIAVLIEHYIKTNNTAKLKSRLRLLIWQPFFQATYNFEKFAVYGNNKANQEKWEQFGENYQKTHFESFLDQCKKGEAKNACTKVLQDAQAMWDSLKA